MIEILSNLIFLDMSNQIIYFKTGAESSLWIFSCCLFLAPHYHFQGLSLFSFCMYWRYKNNQTKNFRLLRIKKKILIVSVKILTIILSLCSSCNFKRINKKVKVHNLITNEKMKLLTFPISHPSQCSQKKPKIHHSF